MLNQYTYKQKLGLILLLNFILCLPGFWVPFYNIDELTNGIFAGLINSGDIGLGHFVGNTYLLTHYVYAFVYKIFPLGSLVPIHVFHMIWRGLTILAFAWSGQNLLGKRGGLWAAIFYCVFSTCFMSKDFHTPSAESFSLLPAVLSVGFFFAAIDKKRLAFYLYAGVFAALAALFKAPMGAMIAVLNLSILMQGQGFLKKIFVTNFAFGFVLLAPVFLVQPWGQGLVLLQEKLNETNTLYLQTQNDVSFLYWFFKYLLRTGLVFLAVFPMGAFALYGMRKVFHFKRREQDYWQMEFLLVVWVILMWFTVALGKRVFYHYFVFLMAPLPLLASAGLHNFQHRMEHFKKEVPSLSLKLLTFVRKYMIVFMVILASVAFVDGALNFSTKPNQVDQAIFYIKENTKKSDRIYVWGNAPQLYFFSERLPSTPYFWSDVLAGTSPGSPAMEYVRATGKTLKVHEALALDMQAKAIDKVKPKDRSLNNGLTPIHESELFTVEEILDRIDHTYWQKVFHDFLKNPPELFLDTAPANIRGFGYYPIHKYELLKRFVLDNYQLETIKDGVVIYRLQKVK